jgi:hypothetical protein
MGWTVPGVAEAGEFRMGTSISLAQPLIDLAVDGPSGGELVARAEPRSELEVGYGHYGVSLSSPFSSSWRNDAADLPRFPAKGWSDDLRAFYHGSAWGVEAYHRQVRGFTSATESASPDGPDERPDITFRSSSVTVFRSLIAESRVYHLSEGRLDTDDDFLPDFLATMAVSRMRLQGDRALIAGWVPENSRFKHLESIEVTSLALGGGVAFATTKSGLYFDPAFFAGYGPQYRVWGDRSDWAWNLFRTNLRLNMGLRCRWFDLGTAFEVDSQKALAGSESAAFNSWTAKAGLEVYL